MKILALESSAVAASAALCEDEMLLGQTYLHTGLTHSQTLLPMAAGLLEQCGLKPQDLDLIAVAAGPGSFTGLRIGVAAAKGLAWAAELPCAGCSTLEAMAWSLARFQGGGLRRHGRPAAPGLQRPLPSERHCPPPPDPRPGHCPGRPGQGVGGDERPADRRGRRGAALLRRPDRRRHPRRLSPPESADAERLGCGPDGIRTGPDRPDRLPPASWCRSTTACPRPSGSGLEREEAAKKQTT